MLGECTYVIQGTIRSYAASFIKIAHLCYDRSDTTRAKTGRSSTYEACESSEELTFGKCRFDAEEVGEDADDHKKLVSGIAANPLE